MGFYHYPINTYGKLFTFLILQLEVNFICLIEKYVCHDYSTKDCICINTLTEYYNNKKSIYFIQNFFTITLI